MIGASRPQDGRVNLDRVDVGGAAAERRGHVVARSGPHHRDIGGGGENAIRQVVVVAHLPAARVVGRPWRREVVHPLVVVARRADYHEPGVAIAQLEQLVGRVDPLPRLLHRPGQDHHRGDGRREPGEQRRGPGHDEQKQRQERHPVPHHGRRPQRAG